MKNHKVEFLLLFSFAFQSSVNLLQFSFMLCACVYSKEKTEYDVEFWWEHVSSVQKEYFWRLSIIFLWSARYQQDRIDSPLLPLYTHNKIMEIIPMTGQPNIFRSLLQISQRVCIHCEHFCSLDKYCVYSFVQMRHAYLQLSFLNLTLLKTQVSIIRQILQNNIKATKGDKHRRKPSRPVLMSQSWGFTHLGPFQEKMRSIV